MGCKQTTVKSPALVLSTSPAAPATTPVYVKSALKKSRVNGKGKAEKRAFAKRKAPTVSKSVNFDENVRIKLRTPTPKQTRYEHTSAKIEPKHNPIDDDDDDDDQLSSISSQEDLRNERIKPTTTIPSHPPLQRNQPPNGYWNKNNSVAALPAKTHIQEKSPPPPVTTTVTYPTESPTFLDGNRFRVRRKVLQSVVPQPSNLFDPNQSPTIPVLRLPAQPIPAPVHRPPVQPVSVPVHQSPVQSVPFPILRPLANTNAILIEHPASFPPDAPSPQTVHYAFNRQPTGKKTSKEK